MRTQNAASLKRAGVFGGLSKSFPVSESAQFSVSAALASMSNSVEVDVNGSEDSSEGDTLGFSTSAALNTALYKSLIGSIGAKYQSYQYDNASENITSLFAKLAYRF